jgi:hypothetical protein
MQALFALAAFSNLKNLAQSGKSTSADFALLLWLLLRLGRRRSFVVETLAAAVTEKCHEATSDQDPDNDSNP